MPYIAPGHGQRALLPRKRKTTSRRGMTGNKASGAKASSDQPQLDDNTISNLSSQLASSSMNSGRESNEIEASSSSSRRSEPSSSNRSSFDSNQRTGERTNKSTTSVPSLIGGATASSVSISSPSGSDTPLPDQYPPNTSMHVDPTGQDGRGSREEEGRSLRTDSDGTSPFPSSSGGSGALTPNTPETSVGMPEDGEIDRLARYKEGLYAYTRDLYVRARETAERKAAEPKYPQFGLKQSGMERMAAKKALAKRLNR